ncbi:MAG TPA: MarC family protein, partial [Xanthobacteraceae bacterium]|nr:MarC family protein [Xanthobacteraceae bacterium]
MPQVPFDYLISSFVTLLLVVEPVGLAPIFVALTEGLPASARREVALRSCIITAGILLGATLVGDWLLHQLGISLAAFRIAGGLLLFSNAYEMVMGVRIERQSKAAEQALEEHVRYMAAFPLAIPLMAGPGAITATILLAGHTGGRPLYIGSLIAIIIAVASVCLIVYLIADQIGKALGITGNVVLSRVLGVVLAALAAQFVI